MNIRDSEFVMGILLERGFEKANSAENADVILFNSCSVRKHAEDRLFSNISGLKDLKKKRSNIIIGLIGCTAQNYKEGVFSKVPMVDFACGSGNITDLPEIIKDVLKNRCPIVAADKVNEKRKELFPKYRNGNFKTHVSISEGCDNFCSYCVVPYVRGRERSRRQKDIIEEVEDLANRGFREITLLGQNVNSYRDSPLRGQSLCRNDFVKLLENINKIDGIKRIRFMTSHPKDASPDLFKAMKNMDKVCEHLHLPLQSGSTRILQLMNRGYTAKRYARLVDSFRKFIPHGSVTTDMIIGFPSETENDFQKTMTLMNEIKFDSAFTFKYSPRPPAKSAELKDDVLQEIKDDRLKALINLQEKISQKRNEPLQGKVLEILVDGRNKKSPTTLTGRTRTNKTVVFEGNKKLIGKFVDVIIESVTPHALKGRMV